MRATRTSVALAAALLSGCTSQPGGSGGPASRSPASPAPATARSAAASTSPQVSGALPAASASATATPTVPRHPVAAGPAEGAASGALHVRVVARLPVPLSRMGVVTTGGRVLALGGLLNARSSGAVYAFDPSTATTRLVGSLRSAVHDTAGVALSGRVLVVGGGAATESRLVQRFSAGHPTTEQGLLPEGRSDLSVVVVGSDMYVIGGYTGTDEVPTVLRSSDGVHFAVVARLPVTVRYAAVVAVGTDIWVIGGDHHRAPSDVVQRIDTRTGHASVVGHLAHSLGHASAWLGTDNTLVVAGGNLTNAIRTDTIARLDLRTLRLTRIARLPRPTSDMGVGQVGGITYLLGGEGTHRLDTIVSVGL